MVRAGPAGWAPRKGPDSLPDAVAAGASPESDDLATPACGEVDAASLAILADELADAACRGPPVDGSCLPVSRLISVPAAGLAGCKAPLLGPWASGVNLAADVSGGAANRLRPG